MRMKFSIMDDKAWKKYSGIRLYSSFPTDSFSDEPRLTREWMCETKNTYLLVKYFGGMLTVGSSERMDNVRDDMSLIARVSDRQKFEVDRTTFTDIKNFMQWHINDDDYAD